MIMTFSTSCSPSQVALEKERSIRKQEMIIDLRLKIEDGETFESIARSFSEGQQATNGGRLGWMKGGELPEIFLAAIRDTEIDELSEPFQSSSGFHLLRVNGIKGNDPVIEEQINVRHILIRTNEILDDAAAEEKLKTIRTQIIDEGDFGAVASAVSEDPGSAQDGGDMGWAPRGFFVPEFEEIAYSLDMNQIFSFQIKIWMAHHSIHRAKGLMTSPKKFKEERLFQP